MAKYKTLRDGDIHMYNAIEDRLVDLATCKGKAFSDSSIEEYERGIESELEEMGLNHADANFGRKSANSELLGSINSSCDYWQRIENKYAKHDGRERTLRAHLLAAADEVKQQAAFKRAKMIKNDDLGKKIELLKKAHEVELRNLRKVSRKACLEFFQAKSEHVMRVFRQEQMYMVDEYFMLKVKDSKKEKTIGHQSRIIQRQERTI